MNFKFFSLLIILSQIMSPAFSGNTDVAQLDYQYYEKLVTEKYMPCSFESSAQAHNTVTREQFEQETDLLACIEKAKQDPQGKSFLNEISHLFNVNINLANFDIIKKKSDHMKLCWMYGLIGLAGLAAVASNITMIPCAIPLVLACPSAYLHLTTLHERAYKSLSEMAYINAKYFRGIESYATIIKTIKQLA